MKKIPFPLLVCVFILGCIVAISSCSKKGFLDQTETSNLDEVVVFSDSAYAMDYLNNIYADVGFSFSPTRFDNN